MCSKCGKVLGIILALTFITTVLTCYLVFADKGMLFLNALPFAVDLVAIVAFAFSVYSFRSDKARERMHLTMEAFPVVRDQLGDLTVQIRKANKLPNEKARENRKMQILRNYAMKMERFAVGVNNGAYDLKIVNEMSGGLLLQHYEEHLANYIALKRAGNSKKYIKSANIYENYEKMIRRIYKMRKLDG